MPINMKILLCLMVFHARLNLQKYASVFFALTLKIALEPLCFDTHIFAYVFCC